MKYFIYLLLFMTFNSAKTLRLKIINTPIYNFIPFLAFHHIALIYNENDIFSIDFSPNENINSPYIIIKLLQGKNIKGKIRINHIKDKSINIYKLKSNIFFENYNSQFLEENFEKLKKIDYCIVDSIKLWNTSFQLYKRNCQHFCKFLQLNYQSELHH